MAKRLCEMTADEFDDYLGELLPGDVKGAIAEYESSYRDQYEDAMLAYADTMYEGRDFS